MLDQSQTCPSCRSSKYSNPQLRLMVNTCGHSLCENCVEVLFVRGSGLCVQCKTPVRKVNFRYQLFEDPLVQKEVEIRKKILSDFNKREDDFDCLEDYDLYLEKIEELVYNLMNDIDVEDCKRYIENYKKENKDIIKKNRLRPSASMLFYETELEREAILREKREREDEERRQNLLKNVAPGNCSTDGECSAVQQQDTPKPPPSSFSRPPTIKPPPSTARPNIQPPSQFFSPASSMCNRLGTDRVFIPPPPSALGGNYVVPPSAIPPSGCSPSVSNWTIGTHHQVLLPSKTTQSPRQPDAVIIPNRSVLARSNTRSDTVSSAFVYTPYEFDLCGPPVPSPNQSRWSDISSVYNNAIISQLRVKKMDTKSDFDQPGQQTEEIKPRLKTDIIRKVEEPDSVRLDVKRSRLSGELLKAEKEEQAEYSETTLVGLSHQLPSGACGLDPLVFLERCLQESRCALFI